MTSLKRKGVALAKQAAKALLQIDPEHVEGGCSDVSETVALFLRRRGYRAEARYGTVHDPSSRERIEHSWLEVEGQPLDLTLWVQGLQRSPYPREAMLDPAIKAKLCYRDEGEGYIEELERALPREKVPTHRQTR
jgi:hypothetical protein